MVVGPHVVDLALSRVDMDSDQFAGGTSESPHGRPVSSAAQNVLDDRVDLWARLVDQPVVGRLSAVQRAEQLVILAKRSSPISILITVFPQRKFTRRLPHVLRTASPRETKRKLMGDTHNCDKLPGIVRKSDLGPISLGPKSRISAQANPLRSERANVFSAQVRRRMTATSHSCEPLARRRSTALIHR